MFLRVADMIGMNRNTGRTIADQDHIAQSIADILTTPIGSRIERREYGSLLPELIDAPANRATFVQLYAASATAIMQFEPRIRLTRVTIDAADQSGSITLSVEGNRNPGGKPFSSLIALGSRGLS